jgi:hypothetical protein
MSSHYSTLEIFYHAGTYPTATLEKLSIESLYREIDGESARFKSETLFALLADANHGISKSMIDLWQFFAERQIPRFLLVQGYESSESDFDDMVLVANRVLEKMATPYLIIHNETGEAAGLVDLKNMKVRSYLSGGISEEDCDESLIDLIDDFRSEYIDEFVNLGSSAFSSGLYPIAVPIGSKLPVGINELNQIIDELTKR